MKKTRYIVSAVISALLCIANLQMSAAAEENIGNEVPEEVMTEQYSDEETVQDESFDESNDQTDSETDDSIPVNEEETAEEY